MARFHMLIMPMMIKKRKLLTLNPQGSVSKTERNKDQDRNFFKISICL